MAQKRPAAANAMVGAGPKRRAAAKAPAATDPMAKLCAAAVAGLREAPDLPEQVKEMMSGMMETSLRKGKDERHEFEDRIVFMAGEVLSGVEGRLQTTLETHLADVAALEAEKKEAEAEVTEADSKVEAAAAVMQDGKRVLAEAAGGFQAAKVAVREAELAQIAGEQATQAIAAKRAELEQAMEQYVKPLAGGGEDAKALEALTSFLQRQSFEASMVEAISVFPPAPARTSFHTLVLNQLSEELSRRLAAAGTEAQEADSARAAQAAALESAKESLAAAQQKQLKSADAFVEAQSEHKKTLTALQDAQQAVSAIISRMRKSTKDVKAAEKRLEAFRNGQLAAYLELRDRVAVPPPAKEEEKPGADKAAPEGAEAPQAAEAPAPVML